MKKLITLTFVASMLALAVLSRPMKDVRNNDEVFVKGDLSGSESNIVFVAADGGLATTGMSLSNFVWQAAQTNVSQILASVGQPNGIARLDTNGKIDASLVENITVVFVGGQAVDVSE